MKADEFLATQRVAFADHVAACKAAVNGLTDEQFAQSPEPGVWSVGQVFEHLNLSIEPYLSAMGAAITHGGTDNGAEPRHSFLGKFIYNALTTHRPVPAPGKLVPKGGGSRADYDRYIENANRFADLFDRAQGKDLNRSTYPNPVMPVFKMNLADGFWIMIAHGGYHLRQIEERAARVCG